MKKLTALLAALTLALTLLFLFLFAGEAKASDFRASNFENFTFSDTFDSQFTVSTFSGFETQAFESVGITDFDRHFQG